MKWFVFGALVTVSGCNCGSTAVESTTTGATGGGTTSAATATAGTTGAATTTASTTTTGAATATTSTTSGATTTTTTAGATTGGTTTSTTATATTGATSSSGTTAVGATSSGTTTSGATSAGTTSGACTALSFIPLPQSAVGEQPVSMAIADFNGDGWLDLAVTNLTGNTISLLLNVGDAGVDGGFAPQVLYAPGGDYPRVPAAADLNGDGRPDLVVPLLEAPASSSGPVAVFENQGTWGTGGDSGFAAPVLYPTPTDTSPGVTVVADFNHDGFPDIAFSDSSFRQVGVFLNLTDGGFGPAQVYAAGVDLSTLAVVDLNQDGWPDLVAASTLTDQVLTFTNTQVWSNGGDAGLGTPVIYPAAYPIGLAVGDFNADGWPDVVVVNELPSAAFPNGSVALYLNSGDGGLTPEVDYSAGIQPLSVAVGDMNGDGRQDIVVGCDNGANIFLNTGVWAEGDAGLAAPVLVDAGVGAAAIKLADLNNDGWLDIALVLTPDTGVTATYLNGCGP